MLLKAQLPDDQLEGNIEEDARMKLEKDSFDLSRLRHALAVLFEDVKLCLLDRLSGALSSPVLGQEAIDMAILAAEHAGKALVIISTLIDEATQLHA